MLQLIRFPKIRATGAPIAIVASEYNRRYVDAMVRAARSELRRAAVRRVELFRVPGAFEIPVVAAKLARAAVAEAANSATMHPALGAIICLGVILRGETVHAAHIGEAVTWALMEIQVRYGIPVIHEVLLLENEAQARARCLGRTHNRGAEAAHTALKMAQVIRKLDSRAT